MNKSGFFIIIFMVFFGCDPFGDHYSDIDEVVYYETKTGITDVFIFTPASVMTWNIKFGGGRIDFWFDCYGDRVHMTTGEVTENLQAITDFINEQMPTVILLQEVDVNSKRTAYIDQVQWLLDNTYLNYGVYASQWQNQFVPSDGLGPVDSGNAILSVYPITGAERITLPLRSDQDGITQHFYLKRNILKAKTILNGFEYWILNLHTSAYSNDGTKKKQIDRFVDELHAISFDGELFVAGGDLNEIPPGSSQLSNFPDSICEDEDFQADDYSDETDWLDELYENYQPAVVLTDYHNNELVFFTHTTDSNGFWARKLDYLFTNQDGGFWQSETHQNTMLLSDHAPTTALIQPYFYDSMGAYFCGEPGDTIDVSCMTDDCPEGFICDTEGCYPSQCECTDDGIICTEDCGGSICVPDN